MGQTDGRTPDRCIMTLLRNANNTQAFIGPSAPESSALTTRLPSHLSALAVGAVCVCACVRACVCVCVCNFTCSFWTENMCHTVKKSSLDFVVLICLFAVYPSCTDCPSQLLDWTFIRLKPV